MRSGGKRWRWRASVATLLVAYAPPVAASCFPTRPPLPAVDPSRPVAERVATLTARSRWIEDGSETAAWRSLLADLARDPAADPELAATAHAGLAQSLQGDANSPEMVAEATRALAIVRANRLETRASHAGILTTVVYKLIVGGRPDEAEPLAAPLLAAARRDWGEHSLEYADAVSAVGWLAYNQGRFEESLGYGATKRDLIVACLPPDDPRVARAEVNLSVSLSSVGRLDEAIAAAFVGARLAADHLREDDPSQLYVLRNLGVLLTGFGRLGEAEAVLRRGVDLAARNHADDQPTRALMISALARAIDLEGRPLDAEALWDRSLALARGTKSKADGYGASITLRRLADSAQRRGDLVTALARRDAALAASPLPPTHPDQANLLLDRARTLAAMGRATEAKAVGGPAFATLVERSPAADTRLLYLTADWAEIVAAADGAEAGWAVLAPVTQRIEALLLDTATPGGDLVNLAPLLRGACVLWARLALATGRDDEAFRALQLVALSAIVVASTDAANRAAAADPAERALLRSLADAVTSRRLAERTRAAAVSGAGAGRGATATQAAIDRANATIAALTVKLDRRYPGYRAASRPAPVSLATFRASLGAGELLVAPLPYGRGTVVVTVSRDGLRSTASATSAPQINALVARIRRSVAAPGRPFDLAAARALRASVLPAALGPLLDRHRSLLWYASGDLASLPPALLAGPGRGDWLIRSHAITILPSLRPAPPRPAIAMRQASFLGIGAPLPGVGATRPPATTLAFRGATVETGSLAALPPLAGAERELRAMQRLIGGDARILTGADATKAALATLPLDRYRVLAFATHGIAAETMAGLGEPALVLSPRADAPGDGDRDALLTASDIARLRLDADWVILSACDSAGGGERGAPVYAGLASAFVEAGARSLLVSHWPVRDDAAARLTVDTLREARDAPSRAVALQRATLRLMADRHIPGAAHPALWAPFVLVGR